MVPPNQNVRFYDFGKQSLSEILELERANFVSLDGNARNFFPQADYINSYVRDPEINCRSLLVEELYIDRDHMEDHSVFYSTSLHPYENWCKRVHFFDIDDVSLRKRFSDIIDIGIKGDARLFRDECNKLSQSSYLGFSVIKPLSGSPVGRTVLRTYGPKKKDGNIRSFPCTRKYTTHLLGLELSVIGLAFQQLLK